MWKKGKRKMCFRDKEFPEQGNVQAPKVAEYFPTH
jgi:hypothetical protein